MKNKKLVCFLQIILFSLNLGGVFGYIEDYSFESDAKFILLDSFGFLKEGTFNFQISLEPESSTLWFLTCNSEEFDDHFKRNSEIPCSEVDEQFCEVAVTFTGANPLNYSNWVTGSGVYYFILANCNGSSLGDSYNANVHYTLLNPGGEQLSSDEIPFPSLYIVLIVVWVLLTGMWSLNWIINRTQRIKLHRVISFFPFAKFAYCGAAVFYWKTLSISGVQTVTSLAVYGALYILFELSFYSILLVISSGWGITRDDLKQDKWIMLVVIFILAVCLSLSFAFGRYAYITLLVMYVVILAMIFRYANRNILGLRDRDSLDSTEPGVPHRSTSAEKLKMYSYFKLIMFGYLFLNILITLVDMVFLQYYKWIYNMLLELLQVTMFICIGWTFRLRSVNLYYRLDGEEPAYYTSNQVRPTTAENIELPSMNSETASTSTSSSNSA